MDLFLLILNLFCFFTAHEFTLEAYNFSSFLKTCYFLLISVPKKCQKAREHFNTVKIHLASLKTKFPADQYYRLVISSLPFPQYTFDTG